MMALAAQGKAIVAPDAIPTVDRKFWAILGFSILFHATLLAVTAWQRSQEPAALPPIIASIRLNLTAPEPVAVAAETPAPATVPQKARQTPTRTERPVATRAMQTAGPADKAPRVAPQVAAQSVSAPSPTAAIEHTAPATPAVAQVAEVARPAPQRPQSEVLDGYRQRLGELFARHQEYPRIAAMRGWEGEVRLRLKVARKGNLVAVVLDRSSGFEVLDQHALAMLEGLASLPPLPEGLDANEIQVVVPVNYKLKKTT